jgi:hypothetical protein
MHKIVAGLTVMGFFLTLGTTASAKIETVTGTLVDLICFTNDHANHTNAHKGMGEKCAESCARHGLPVAVATRDGKVYQVVGNLTNDNNAKLVPLMASTVEMTGDVLTVGDKMFISGTSVKQVKQ